MAKILIAEDEPEIVQFCAFSLQTEKHEVVSTDNGPDAIEKLKKEKPDLLILDIMLPGIDGYTLQLQISEDPVLSKIPVIIISALKPAKELFDKFTQVVAFLPKPFSSQDLLGAVRKGLKK